MRTHSAHSRKTLAGIVTALLVLCTGAARAGTILIDFNDNSTAGSGWNTFHSGNDNGTRSLVWDDGTSSGISIQLPQFTDSANAGWNPGNALPSWAPSSVADDYSYFNQTTVQFVLSGLDSASVYSIDVIVSRNLDRDQDFTITHGGGVASYDNWNSQTDGWQAGNVLTFANLTPDAIDEMVMDIEREGVSWSINAMRITSAVPEPNTLSLLTLGVVAAAACPRRYPGTPRSSGLLEG